MNKLIEEKYPDLYKEAVYSGIWVDWFVAGSAFFYYPAASLMGLATTGLNFISLLFIGIACAVIHNIIVRVKTKKTDEAYNQLVALIEKDYPHLRVTGRNNKRLQFMRDG